MKKSIIALTVLFALLFTGCSGSSNDSASVEVQTSSDIYYDMEEEIYYEDDIVASEEAAASDDGFSNVESASPESTAGGAELSEIQTHDKIIYSGDAYIETKDFDASVANVNSLVSNHNGFIENSSIGGISYDDGGARYASFTIRIPSTSFEEISENLSDLGNVTHYGTYAQNVTSQYVDIEARLSSYRTQEDRLLSMLEQATNLEELLILESHLTEVRYNIEHYTTSFNALKNEIEYSTIMIELSEVVEFSPDQPLEVSFLTEMGDAFADSISGLILFVQGIILMLLTFWPFFIIVAIITYFIIRQIRKDRKKRAEFKEKQKILNMEKDNTDE